MMRLITTAALAAILATGAIAQNAGVDQLKEQIMTSQCAIGLDVDLDALTDEQIVEISEIIATQDEDDCRSRLQRRIEAIAADG